MLNFVKSPTGDRFYELLQRSADNAGLGARLLADLLNDFRDVPSRVAQITEVEHQGDFLVHEIMDLLRASFLTPLDPERIRALASRLDDVVDAVEAAAQALVLYRVDQPIPEVQTQAALLVRLTQEIDQAVPSLARRSSYPAMLGHAARIGELETDADQVGRAALARLVEERTDWFELLRWKEILERLEAAADRCEDVGDVLRVVAQENA